MPVTSPPSTRSPTRRPRGRAARKSTTLPTRRPHRHATRLPTTACPGPKRPGSGASGDETADASGDALGEDSDDVPPGETANERAVAAANGTPGEPDVEVDPADERTAAADEIGTGARTEPVDPDAAPSEGEETPGSAALRADLGALPSLRILFRSASDRLTAESLDTLDAMAEVLSRHPGVPITIGGHTDAAGGTSVNLQLSQLRANAVREYLVTRGVERERITARGYGESLPIADNATAEGRAINRRIEFTY